MDLSAELSSSMYDRIIKLSELLDTTSEEELNSQPLPNKKSPAEIMSHILLVDWAPLWFWRIFYGSLNLVYKLYDKLKAKEIRKTAETWNLESGKPRNAKFIAKSKLMKKFEKNKPKISKRAEKITSRQQNTLKVMERHTWGHLAQIDVLLAMQSSSE